jgi:localization factor PodJL
MKPGAPWSIKGIEPEAREAAKEKAREAGMTLGQWLNQAIADSGQPKTSEPAPAAGSGGSALETARIMRAIAEVARRVDLVAANAGEPSAGGNAGMDRLSARVEELAKAIPAAPKLDQSRLERGLVAIVKRIDQLENATKPAEMLEGLRDEIRKQPAAPLDAGKFEASIGAVGSQLDQLSSRLSGLEQSLSEREQPNPAIQPAEAPDVRPELAQLSQDVRKLMNGMVNLAARIDTIDERAEGRLQPVQASIAELQSETSNRNAEDRQALEARLDGMATADRTGSDNGAIQAAVAAALLPVTGAIAGLQERLDRQTDTTPPPAVNQSDELQVDPTTISTDTVDAVDRDDELSASATRGIGPSFDPVDPVDTEDHRPEPESEPVAEPAVPAGSNETLSGLASLHDLTRADDIRVQPFDDEQSFFREIEADEVEEEAAVPGPDNADELVIPASSASDEVVDDQGPSDETRGGAEGGTPSAAETPPSDDRLPPPDFPTERLNHVPAEAAPPDRPRRLVPVESLLSRPAPTSNEPSMAAATVSRAAPAPDRPAAQDEGPVGAPPSGERKPFRLDEPLDLSRQAPAPPPASYPGGRRWIGYLLVALFFLVLFVGGFWFTGTAQFRDIADEAGQLWEQAVTAVKGIELESDAGDASSTSSQQPADNSANAVSSQESSATAPAQGLAAPTVAQAAANAPAESAAKDTRTAALAPQPEASTPAAPQPAPAPAAPKTELELLQDKAEAGDANAQYTLGVRHRDGIGLEPNYSSAAEWFDRAAQQGHVAAQLGLGIMYRQGLGRPRDLDLAKLWLHAAARAGEPDAQKLLGEVYVDDTAGVPDYFQAARWFREAAEQGVVDAQYNMGVLYEGGLGVPRDFAQSYFWFSLAARSGDSSAPEDRERVAQLLTPEQRTKLDSQVAGFTAAAAPAPAATSGSVDTNEAILHRRDEIRILQQLLIARGYDPGSPDGIPGAKTREAILAWQSDQGMAKDGQITRNVLDSLKAGG